MLPSKRGSTAKGWLGAGEGGSGSRRRREGGALNERAWAVLVAAVDGGVDD